MIPKEWLRRKKERLKRIERDKSIGYFDEKIDELVNLINAVPDLSTTSSCSGRIIFYESEGPWGFGHGEIIAKFHDIITEELLENVLKKPVKKILWASAQGPIIHVACRDIYSASWLNKLARRVGFKHGGIISVEDEVVLELRAVDRVDIPLKYREALLVNDLSVIADILNSVLKRGWEKIEKLSSLLSNIDEYEFLREK